MTGFKAKFYENYVSSHNQQLYGDNSIERIRSRFPSWQYYFGAHLPANKDARILDIGCGDGNFVYWLHSIGYKNAQGVDVSAQQIEAGKKLGIESLHCGDLYEFLEQQRDFDFIVARDVIEHFTRDDVFNIFLRVNEKLSSNGSFMIQVPCGEGLHYTSIFYGDYTHEMAYTSSSISQISINAGFSSSQCYPVGPAPLGLVSRIRYVLWSFKAWKHRFWKMVETGNGKGIFTQNLIAVIKK
jgi:SAM-dependent methyltransferase